MSSRKRIVKNTSILYTRMILVMLINLVTVRYIYTNLGNEQYGLLNLITGFVTMFQSVSTVLASSSQRFYSFALGQEDFSQLASIHSSTLKIYFVFGIIIILLGETIGLWFVTTHLNIAEIYKNDTTILYQLSLFTFLFHIFQAPFLSIVMAEEKMNIFAIISTAECVLKFFAAYSISFIISSQRLIIYGIMLLAIALLSFFAYYIYSKNKFSYSNYITKAKISHFKELLSFSGWHLYSSIASIGMLQINTVLINIYYGLIANAARAVSLQINSALVSFSGGFITALRPPIIKAYASSNYIEVNSLFDISNKLIVFLMSLIALPLYAYMPQILNMWLGHSDEMTLIFSRLILIYTFILSLNNPISIIVQATGRVKNYFCFVEVFTILCPIATLILFKAGANVEWAYYTMIIAISLSHIVRLFCLKIVYQYFSLRKYIKSFIIPSLLLISIVCGFNYLVPLLFSNILIHIAISISITVITSYIILLNNTEKQIIKKQLLNLLYKK